MAAIARIALAATLVCASGCKLDIPQDVSWYAHATDKALPPTVVAGSAGSSCVPGSDTEGCWAGHKMTCNPVISQWVIAATCTTGQVCLERGGPHIVDLDGLGDTACCAAPPKVSCQAMCEQAALIDTQRALPAWAQKVGLTYGCDPTSPACLCKAWAEGEPGICRVPCEGVAGLGPANHWSGVEFLLRDRRFTDIQVVSAFPSRTDAGATARVCGASLPGEVAVVPNGVELTVNLVGTQPFDSACADDADLSVKSGELIELSKVSAEGNKPTIGPANFSIALQCVEPHGPVPAGGVSGCSTALSSANLVATQVRYENIVNRCDEKDESTRLNLAILVDHSGSISGFVDKNTLLEDQLGYVDQPDKLEPSDKIHARIIATERLVDELNSHDRVIAYYFDEEVGAAVAASDQLACEGGTRHGKRCVDDSECPDGIGCFRSSGDAADPVLDTFLDKPLNMAEQDAFGSSKVSRIFLKAALNFKVKYGGDGRAPLWHGVQTAYNFLKSGSLSAAKGRHIVIITDGPDTCSDSDDFVYKNSGGKCRVPCASATAGFDAVLKQMHADKYPVFVHFIQFQAQAQQYRKPDPRMMELACRTGGTYQFINSQEMNASSSEFANALKGAALRVRYALSGSWRVTVPLPYFGPAKELSPGTLYGARGQLQLKSELFPGLDQVYAYQGAWRYGIETGNEDRRVLFRTACASHGECGGSGDCAEKHCSATGLCVASKTQDQQHCGGGGGVCCAGTCDTQTSCTQSCQE